MDTAVHVCNPGASKVRCEAELEESLGSKAD